MKHSWENSVQPSKVLCVRNLRQWFYHQLQNKFLSRMPKAFPLSTPYASFLRDGGDELIFSPKVLCDVELFIDFGAFKGQSLKRALEIDNVLVVGFEPVTEFYEQLNQSIGANDRVQLHNCLIGVEDGLMTLRVEGDRSGAWAEGREVDVTVRKPDHFFGEFPNVKSAALINIEGGEYELIPLLSTWGVIAKFNYIFIQFHRLPDESATSHLMGICYSTLERTHSLKWKYDFVWERWDRKVILNNYETDSL